MTLQLGSTIYYRHRYKGKVEEGTDTISVYSDKYLKIQKFPWLAVWKNQMTSNMTDNQKLYVYESEEQFLAIEENKRLQSIIKSFDFSGMDLQTVRRIYEFIMNIKNGTSL